MFRLAGKFLHHVLPGVLRPLQVLWNQIIGFLFIIFAIVAFSWAVRDFRDPSHYPRLYLEVPFMLVMAYFGLSSFFRARKLSRP